jgi:hypothetical protein
VLDYNKLNNHMSDLESDNHSIKLEDNNQEQDEDMDRQISNENL